MQESNLENRLETIQHYQFDLTFYGIFNVSSFLTANTKKKKQTRQVIVCEKWVVGVKYSGTKNYYIALLVLS